MNKNIFRLWLIVISVSVLVILAIVLVTISNSNSDTSNQIINVISEIVSNEKNYDFGIIGIKDGDVSHIYKLKNEGQQPVLIEKVYTSCMCTTAFVTSQSNSKAGPYGMQGHRGLSREIVEIAPGEEFEVKAVYDPMAHGPSGVGMVQRSIYLETNSDNSPKIELRFIAQVIN